MIRIPLRSLPVQSFSITLNGRGYDILIRAVNTLASQVMCFDVTIDNVISVLGQRVVAGTPVIPYRELTDNGGNFVLLTNEGDLPDYNLFDISQYLIFATQDEIDAIT